MIYYLEPNNSVDKTFDNSVLPTPVGPTNKKEPIGRYLDFNPARLRRIAFAIWSTAVSWPTTFSLKCSAKCRSLFCSSSCNFVTGIPVFRSEEHTSELQSR